jgi:nucleoside-diphosphate-sugar epimerase
MGASDYILLTGATGFLGRYLLQNLLASGQRVAVLARDAAGISAEQRIVDLLSPWSDTWHNRQANPVVLAGDLSIPGLGLPLAARTWIGHHCSRVVHAAADISLRRTYLSDPWMTNVEGTQHLLDLCAALGLRELHHVSTAFVCGERSGPIREDELDRGQTFHNDYERSKFEAERRIHAARGLRATVYRPSVIVGDSRTGFTSSYHGFYRFLELGFRLATPPSPPPSAPAAPRVPAAGGTGRRHLPLRLPLTGDEPRNLVPVDWVARAIVALLDRPECHGRTYHLVAQTPVSGREIKEVAEEVLGIHGVHWAGPGAAHDRSRLEELFLEQLQEYWPYFHGDPVFDCHNTRAALPDLLPPQIDPQLLAGLIRFAVADQWGHARRNMVPARTGVSCAHYVEQFFPRAVRRSTLAGIPIEVTVGMEVTGTGGGHWSCRWIGGDPAIRRGLVPDAEVTYRMDAATFEDVVRGRLAPQEAFLARRIEIEGDVERGLKLAVLFDHLVKECPYVPDSPQEEVDADAVRA